MIIVYYYIYKSASNKVYYSHFGQKKETEQRERETETKTEKETETFQTLNHNERGGESED